MAHLIRRSASPLFVDQDGDMDDEQEPPLKRSTSHRIPTQQSLTPPSTPSSRDPRLAPSRAPARSPHTMSSQAHAQPPQYAPRGPATSRSPSSGAPPYHAMQQPNRPHGFGDSWRPDSRPFKRPKHGRDAMQDDYDRQRPHSSPYQSEALERHLAAATDDFYNKRLRAAEIEIQRLRDDIQKQDQQLKTQAAEIKQRDEELRKKDGSAHWQKLFIDEQTDKMAKDQKIGELQKQLQAKTAKSQQEAGQHAAEIDNLKQKSKHEAEQHATEIDSLKQRLDGLQAEHSKSQATDLNIDRLAKALDTATRCTLSRHERPYIIWGERMQDVYDSAVVFLKGLKDAEATDTSNSALGPSTGKDEEGIAKPAAAPKDNESA